nr:Fic family protein [Aurantimonas sp. VKM B-3413]
MCYPGTDVLGNKAGIEDPEALAEFELSMFLIRADEEFPPGALDYAHYRALHHHLFQDVYAWAGEPRRIRIGKGGNWFCYPEYIDRVMIRIFSDLAAENHLMGLAPAAFAAQAAHVLAEINAVHPFREGNGRTQLTFLTLLAENAGFTLDADVLEPQTVIGAMIDSFSGDEVALAALVESALHGKPQGGLAA